MIAEVATRLRSHALGMADVENVGTLHTLGNEAGFYVELGDGTKLVVSVQRSQA